MRNLGVLVARGGCDAGTTLGRQVAAQCLISNSLQQPYTSSTRQHIRACHTDLLLSCRANRHNLLISRGFKARRWTNVLVMSNTSKPRCNHHGFRQFHRGSTVREKLGPWTMDLEKLNRVAQSQSQSQSNPKERAKEEAELELFRPSVPDQDNPLFPPEVFEGVEDTEILKLKDSGYYRPSSLYGRAAIQASEFTRALFPFGRPSDPGKDPGDTTESSSTSKDRKSERPIDPSKFNADLSYQSPLTDDAMWGSKIASWYRANDMSGRGVSVRELMVLREVRLFVLIAFSMYILYRLTEFLERRARRRAAKTGNHLSTPEDASGNGDHGDRKYTGFFQSMVSVLRKFSSRESAGRKQTGESETTTSTTATTTATTKDSTNIPFGSGTTNREVPSDSAAPLIETLDPKSGDLVQKSSDITKDTDGTETGHDDRQHQHGKESEQPASSPTSSSKPPSTSASSSSWKNWLLFWR